MGVRTYYTESVIFCVDLSMGRKHSLITNWFLSGRQAILQGFCPGRWLRLCYDRLFIPRQLSNQKAAKVRRPRLGGTGR